ncbi:hypothetical protein BZZ01_14595 [Nostocales cyanobacterium HT-58-2]|nr:hypothetical protein BZZ01_14595 [Nostocales cyanobacterium HT-58-2]
MIKFQLMPFCTSAVVCNIRTQAKTISFGINTTSDVNVAKLKQNVINNFVLNANERTKIETDRLAL